jgi:hypothetical protein
MTRDIDQPGRHADFPGVLSLPLTDVVNPATTSSTANL